MMRILLAGLLVLGCAVPLAAQEAPKLKALILTGYDRYHQWRETTPQLRALLEGTGRFQVWVNEEGRGMGLETLAPYDVVVLNYNDFKNSGPWWDARARYALLDYVRNGGGVVSFHAANNAFWGWEEYDKLIGGTWRETAGHAPYHSYTIKLVDREHPITQGLPETFAQNDELYHKLSLQPGLQVLATAYDDPKNCYKPGEGCGTGKDEPLVWVKPYGQGRVFQTALGHDVKAMQSPGFAITLQRGTEWAATGKVTIPPPAEMK